MNDELRDIIEGRFDTVPAVQALAMRLLQLEQDLGRLVVVGPIEDLPEGQAATKRAPSKKGAP